jgi:hypothetical protein
MNRIFYVLLFGMIAMACQTTKTTEGEAVADEQPRPNQLTPLQIAEGWTLLFDGERMKGWRTFRNKENNSWEVADGSLHCKPFIKDEADKRADLITNEQYENFELEFDFKLAPGSNSGVLYRVSEEYDRSYATGPEYQVIDDKGYPDNLKDVQRTAANYDMHAATSRKLHPVGEWNAGKIVVHNNHVEHWLNGEKVVEYELHDGDWKSRRDNSKWKDFPGYGMAPKGHIALQDHDNEVWYRNIRIKEL